MGQIFTEKALEVGKGHIYKMKTEKIGCIARTDGSEFWKVSLDLV